MTSAATILVVDDDIDIRESMRDALEDEGYAVLEAADGLEALAQLRAAKPHLILLDLMMPRMNGAEFRQEMVREEGWSSIPVLVLSADANARAKARALGVAGCLVKPLELDELFATVARLLLPAQHQPEP